MSYCRFSHDDHRSDVYVYESPEGFVIHVAATKLVLPDELPKWSLSEIAGIDFKSVQVGNKAEKAKLADLTARKDAYTKILDAAPRVRIGGLYDGASFTHDEPGQAASALRHLRAAGYHIPAGVIEALDSEQDELEAAEAVAANA